MLENIATGGDKETVIYFQGFQLKIPSLLAGAAAH